MYHSPGRARTCYSTWAEKFAWLFCAMNYSRYFCSVFCSVAVGEPWKMLRHVEFSLSREGHGSRPHLGLYGVAPCGRVTWSCCASSELLPASLRARCIALRLGPHISMDGCLVPVDMAGVGKQRWRQVRALQSIQQPSSMTKDQLGTSNQHHLPPRLIHDCRLGLWTTTSIALW